MLDMMASFLRVVIWHVCLADMSGLSNPYPICQMCDLHSI